MPFSRLFALKIVEPTTHHPLYLMNFRKYICNTWILCVEKMKYKNQIKLFAINNLFSFEIGGFSLMCALVSGNHSNECL